MRTIHGEIPTCACATFSSLCKCWIAVVMSSCSFCSCWLSEILANRSCEFSGTPFYMTILQKLHNAFWEVLTYIRTYIIIYIYIDIYLHLHVKYNTPLCVQQMQLYTWLCQHGILVQQALSLERYTLSLPGVTPGPSPTDKRRALQQQRQQTAVNLFMVTEQWSWKHPGELQTNNNNKEHLGSSPTQHRPRAQQQRRGNKLNSTTNCTWRKARGLDPNSRVWGTNKKKWQQVMT